MGSPSVAASDTRKTLLTLLKRGEFDISWTSSGSVRMSVLADLATVHQGGDRSAFNEARSSAGEASEGTP